MVGNFKSKKQEGFTIIEVLIVLAIAGLMMLVVFLAVPALQRNSRNTSRRSDVAQIAASLGEWSTNNGGRVVNGGSPTAEVLAANLQAVIQGAGTLSQYTLAPATAIGANSFTAATGAQGAMAAGANNVNLGSVQVVTSATCDDGTQGATLVNTSTRRTALQYLVENANGLTPQCLNVQ